MPTFHTIGMYIQLYYPLVSGYAVAVYTPQGGASPIMPNPKNVLEVARITDCTALPSVPAFLEVIVLDYVLVLVLTISFGRHGLNLKKTSSSWRPWR